MEAISFRTVGRVLRQSASRVARSLHLQRLDHALGHVALKRRYVLEVAIVILGPEMITVTDVDELSGDAQLLPGFANASFQHCIDMQLITDFPENIRFGFALESETRCPARHAQPWHPGQRVN